MSRFYVTPGSVKGDKIYVGREESHHIVDVMRLRKGDSVTVFDGTGRRYQGTIASAENKMVVMDVQRSELSAKRREAGIALAQAIPKKDKMDLIVQKAAELGVEEILPLESSRTIVRAKGEKKQRKIERWNKIALEASKQCARVDLAAVKEVERFPAVLERTSDYDLVIMPCLSKKAIHIKEALKNIKKPNRILAIVGPEGGFTEDEIEQAHRKGVTLVSLGDLILRSDTAAIAILSILNYECN